MAQNKPKERGKSCNPCKYRSDGNESTYDIPLVDYEPKTKFQLFVYGDSEDRALETSDIVTPMSPHALKLFKAIREEDTDLIEDELSKLSERHEIDKLDRHGLALIHIAARYNLSRIVITLLDHGSDVNIGSSQCGWTPLHLAARFNGLSTADVLLQRGADPSVKDKKGSTPLHFAAHRGNDEIVDLLLQQPSFNVDAEDGSGSNALHLACSEGHIKVCQQLLDYGVDIQAVSANETTPLQAAIVNGHLQVARIILDRVNNKGVNTTGKKLPEKEDLQSDNNAVLHMATWKNDIETAEYCLDHDADVNSRKDNDTSALHMAATKGNLEIAELLISRGAVVNLQDGDSKTPLHRAALFNQTNLVSLLVEKEAKLDARDGEGRSPFLNAVAAGHVDSARVLLKLGADISATDLLMKTCVHIAIENEQLEMLAMILEGPVGTDNLYKADLWDRVPLHYAAKSKDIEILELVLSKQKCLSFRDENKKTPLHLAAESSSSQHVEALARRMSGVNERDELGRTALHSAAWNGQRKECLTLLNMGAEVDSRDNNYRTALMSAANGNHLKCAEILLDNKASVDLQDTDGDSALHVACGQGHAGIVSLLLDRGASLTLRNKRGHACLEVAANAGSSDVAMAIVKHKRWKELETDYQATNDQSIFSFLVENFPEAAEVALNQCVDHSQHLNTSDPDYNVTYNFKYLDPGPDSSVRFSAVEKMIEHRHEQLLLHPLTLKFNERKWMALGRFAFFFEFVTYLILMVIFTVCVTKSVDIDVPPRPINSTNASSLDQLGLYRLPKCSFLEVVMVIVLSAMHILKEVVKAYVLGAKNYLREAYNTLDLFLYLFAVYSMLVVILSPQQYWIVASVTIFVGYINMLYYLGRYRFFGTYISMYVSVTYTVFKVMVVFVFLVIGFALVFHILLINLDEFNTFPHSVLSVVFIMIGDLNFGNIFSQTVDTGQGILFPGITFLFLFICLMCLSVALMNLLVGLAVGDIQTIEKSATIDRIAMQLRDNMEVEKIYPKCMTRASSYRMVYVEKPPKHDRELRITFFLRLATMVWREETPKPLTEESKPSELAELQEEMTKNKTRVKSMIAMIEALKEQMENQNKVREVQHQEREVQHKQEVKALHMQMEALHMQTEAQNKEREVQHKQEVEALHMQMEAQNKEREALNKQMETQNKLLKSLALTIDPSFELPESTE